MKTYLKDKQEVNIRLANVEDAKDMIDFYNIVGGETKFLSFGENEFSMSLDEYKDFIESVKKQENSIIILAIAENKIISIASITSSQKVRHKHVGEFGIVISKKYCGMGLGKILMDYLINWAKSNGVTKKIGLLTNEDNFVAIKLYKKIGFKIDCILENDNYIDGKYLNTIMMSLLI